MRLLIDECCDRSLARMLSAAGHDVVHMRDRVHGDSDIQVAAYALEQKRLIVTYDYDFGELLVRGQIVALGVLLIDSGAFSSGGKIDAAVKAVAEFGETLLGQLTVVSKRTRQRPIP